MVSPHVEYEVLVSCVDADDHWAEMLVERLRRKNIPTRLNDRKEPIGQQLRGWIRGITGDVAPRSRKLIAVCSQAYLDDAQARRLIAEFSREQASRLVGERLLIPLLRDGCRPPPEWGALPAIDFSREQDFELRLYHLTEALDWRSEPQNGFHSLSAALIRRILGRKVGSEKSDFAGVVAEIYRMLDWEVGPIHVFDAHSGEFSIARSDAGFRKKGVVECHDTVLSPEICGQIVERARQNFHTQRIVIASHPVPADLDDALHQVEVYCHPYTELLDELAPLKIYAKTLIEEFEQWRTEHWADEDWFIRPDVTLDDEEDGPRESAISHIASWLEDQQSRHLAILGDIGMGKTTLMRFVAAELARAFLADPLRHPAPIFIELLHVRKATNLRTVLIEHFLTKKTDLKNVNRWEQLIKAGRIVLLLDAFDEMADRLHDEIQKKGNLEGLLAPAKAGAKIVITSRTHYFKSYSEQVRSLGQDAKYIYLAEFTEEQVQEYLGKARPATNADDWKIIRDIYSLIELVRRPLFMNMVVERLPAQGVSTGPRSSRLYSDYVELWLERERKKDRRLPDQARTGLMEELAWLLKRNEEISVGYDQVQAFTEQIMGMGLFNFNGLKSEEVVGEVCTASFLKRDREGKFRFADRSFQEYFIASRLQQCFADDRREASLMEMLAAGPLEQRVMYFLTQLNEDRSVTPITP